VTIHGDPVVWICERCDSEQAAYPGAMPRGWVKIPSGAIRCPGCLHNSAAAAKRAKMKARGQKSDEF